MIFVIFINSMLDKLREEGYLALRKKGAQVSDPRGHFSSQSLAIIFFSLLLFLLTPPLTPLPTPTPSP